jgi:hypothetical protein
MDSARTAARSLLSTQDQPVHGSPSCQSDCALPSPPTTRLTAAPASRLPFSELGSSARSACSTLSHPIPTEADVLQFGPGCLGEVGTPDRPDAVLLCIAHTIPRLRTFRAVQLALLRCRQPMAPIRLLSAFPDRYPRRGIGADPSASTPDAGSSGCRCYFCLSASRVTQR